MNICIHIHIHMCVYLHTHWDLSYLLQGLVCWMCVGVVGCVYVRCAASCHIYIYIYIYTYIHMHIYVYLIILSWTPPSPSIGTLPSPPFPLSQQSIVEKLAAVEMVSEAIDCSHSENRKPPTGWKVKPSRQRWGLVCANRTTPTVGCVRRELPRSAAHAGPRLRLFWAQQKYHLSLLVSSFLSHTFSPFLPSSLAPSLSVSLYLFLFFSPHPDLFSRRFWHEQSVSRIQMHCVARSNGLCTTYKWVVCTANNSSAFTQNEQNMRVTDSSIYFPTCIVIGTALLKWLVPLLDNGDRGRREKGQRANFLNMRETEGLKENWICVYPLKESWICTYIHIFL